MMMSQHFLLSAKARSLSLAKVMRLSDEEAYETFKRIRWDDEPYCPRCGCLALYEYRSRRIFKCKGCGSQFSVTTDTIFASRKMAYRDLLAAIAIFVNGAKGISALQLSRDLDCQYKTAFVLAHKLREAMGAKIQGQTLSGTVEIDGAYFGGYIKPENRKENRKDRRRAEHQTGKRRVVVSANVRGRDLGSFVLDVQRAVATDVELPPGYWIEYGGTFEQLASAAARLEVVVPLTLLVIFVLLVIALGSPRDAAVIFSRTSAPP
jgi:transposase-like protein